MKKPFGWKLDVITSNANELVINIKIKSWYKPIFFYKIFWHNFDMKPIIFKPFVGLWAMYKLTK